MGITADNVAHFAHLGGLLFGWLLVLYWRHINWREPRIFDWWDKLKARRQERLDSSDDHYKDFHYHKRV